MKKKIVILFVDQNEQRYETLDDYGETDQEIWFKITRMADPRHTMAILIHALWERFAAQQGGVSDEQITRWDLEHPELEEPGADPRAPYAAAHAQAEALERLAILAGGEDWSNYEQALEGMFKPH